MRHFICRTERKIYQISALLKQSVSIENIALPSTVIKAQFIENLAVIVEKQTAALKPLTKLALRSRSQAENYKIPSVRMAFIRLLVEHDCSSKQASEMPVSPEWIYQLIADKAMGGKLYRYLRQGHKRYCKGKRTKAEVAASIDDRPAVNASETGKSIWC